MVKDIEYLLKENEKLIQERNQLFEKLKEANIVINAVQEDDCGIIFTVNNCMTKNLISEDADQIFRQFIANMSEGVVTIHTNGIILYCNSSFTKVINLPIEKVIGTNLRSFIPADKKENFEKLINDFSNNYKLELSIVNKEGIKNHFIVSMNKIQLQDLNALNLVWTDVSEQKASEEKLLMLNENLNRAIEERIISENEIVILNSRLKENIKILEDANNELATFTHIASHDLQEPLRKITTYSSILMNDYHEVLDQQGKNYIKSMQGASERMRNLINDILEYSDLSQKDFSFMPTSLDIIINEVFSSLEPVINETKAEITIEKELPVIEANAHQMKQLFQNIISNSLKFKKKDTRPEIHISYEIEGKEMKKTDENKLNEKYCKFYIKDNGIGFKPEYNNKIFTIFQKLNNNSMYHGTGIGLAICKKIVDRHNGFISAESKPNEGSLFMITLPFKQVHDQQNGFSLNGMQKEMV